MAVPSLQVYEGWGLSVPLIFFWIKNCDCGLVTGCGLPVRVGIVGYVDKNLLFQKNGFQWWLEASLSLSLSRPVLKMDDWGMRMALEKRSFV